MTDFTVEHISDTHTRLRYASQEILLLGTAHISLESLEEVKKTISDEVPDHICVEIDEGRLKNLEEGTRWASMDLKKILKKGQGFVLMANLSLASFQRRLGADMGMKPGDEMKAAVISAREAGIPFSCSDRPIQITLGRAWRLNGWWSKMKLLSSLIASVFSTEKVTAEDIEDLKKTDALQGMMDELADYLPTVKSVLIDERDHYLATKIFQTSGKRILAVVGAGHVPGIITILRELAEGRRDADITDIESLPPKGRWTKLWPWAIPILIGTLFVLGFLRSGAEKSMEMSLVWILANGILAALGALLALAHPLTILISFIGAPLTSLNPTIGVGMVAGLLEYLFRNPRVRDMENLNNDVTSIRGWYRNRVTRILLVFLFSSIGSMVGTLVAIPWLTRIVGN